LIFTPIVVKKQGLIFIVIFVEGCGLMLILQRRYLFGRGFIEAHNLLFEARHLLLQLHPPFLEPPRLFLQLLYLLSWERE